MRSKINTYSDVDLRKTQSVQTGSGNWYKLVRSDEVLR